MRDRRQAAPAAVLYTRAGCPLCFTLRRAAARAARRHRVPLRIVDIGEDGDLARRYANDVPLLSLPDGTTFRGRADPDDLALAFAGAARAAGARGGVAAGSGTGVPWLARLLAAVGIRRQVER